MQEQDKNWRDQSPDNNGEYFHPILCTMWNLTSHRVCVFSLSGKHLEVQLVILELLEEDSGTELKCICQNEDQKQEVVTQIKLEGG